MGTTAPLRWWRGSTIVACVGVRALATYVLVGACVAPYAWGRHGATAARWQGSV